MGKKAIPIATRTKGHRSRCQQVATGADYTPDELEFLTAVDAYKRQTGRAFPAWTEILALFVSLGYKKETP